MQGDEMDNLKKVIQVGMTRNMGGLETYLMQQFDAIDKSKLHYDFVNITSEYDIAFRDKILIKGSKIYSICSRHINPFKHYYQWIKLFRDTKGKYDAIVLNSNSLAYIFPLFAALFFGIPMRVIHSHNADFEVKINFVRKVVICLNKLLMRMSATHYLACSQKAGEWMFGKDKGFIIVHNAIEPAPYIFDKEKRDKVRESLKIKSKFVIGHVGRFTYQKNHKKVIEIFKEICSLNSESILLLVGDAVGDKSFFDKAKLQVKELGIEDKVLFLGIRTDVPDLMQAMDCFLLPSRFEGLPLVGIEAQAAGLPCFFSDNITKELAITDLANYISLNDKSDIWAQEILKSNKYKRMNMSEEVRKAGYDIFEEVKKIEKFYLE